MMENKDGFERLSCRNTECKLDFYQSEFAFLPFQFQRDLINYNILADHPQSLNKYAVTLFFLKSIDFIPAYGVMAMSVCALRNTSPHHMTISVSVTHPMFH